MPTYENDTRQTTGRPQPNASERLAPIGALNKPLVCEDCGSTFFYSSYAEQFATGGHGSAEFRSISSSQITVRVCLCGSTLIPSIQSQGGAASVQQSRSEFYRSAKAAKDRRKALSPDVVAKAVPSRAELNELKGLIVELQKEVALLQTQHNKLGSFPETQALEASPTTVKVQRGKPSRKTTPTTD